MLKKLLAAAFVIMPLALFAQSGPVKDAPDKKEKSALSVTNIPVQAQYSGKFEVEHCYFNRRIDPGGKGELLEVEIILKSRQNDPLDMYIFTVATYEKVEKTKSSFELPVPERERIRNLVPYPDDIKNYEYDNPDAKGKTMLVKHPKNPKAGIDPATGKPYTLKDRLVVRTYHLSPYRVDYVFFNNVIILIFDGEGNPLYRKLYEIKGRRR
ncbi:MAG TPA: hypothetical protein VLM75_07045 [Spirochaetota bacterium]|nr:hypothetical protein [Spirochaetota bacterium]